MNNLFNINKANNIISLFSLSRTVREREKQPVLAVIKDNEL